MRRAYKYRLHPNRNQARELDIMLETHRRLYNDCLAQRKEAYEKEKRSIKYTDQSAWFKLQRVDNPWFAKLNFSSAQATMRRLNKAFQNFFRRVKIGDKPGYPRFKANGRFDSIEFPKHGDGIRLIDNKVRIQHVGMVKVKIHREHQGIIKTLSVKKEAEKWFLVLSCDLGEQYVQPTSEAEIGLDLGINAFLATSDGEMVENPRFLNNELKELRRVQRSVSRKKLRGKNRAKTVKRLRTLHQLIRNKRNDFHHKLALEFTQRYGLIAVESLSVKNMQKNHRLARSIADVGWSNFLAILKYKAEEAGHQVIEVDPKGTSQQCSACGATVKKSLSVRVHRCSCGLVLDRDVNAARNILKLGLGRANGTQRLALASVSQEAVVL